MLRHRMWLVVLGYLAITIALQVALSLIGASGTVMTVVAALLALLVGFEAATLRRFTLGRRRWTNVGIVVGDDTETAERRFFDAWVDRGGSDNVAWASAPPPSAATVLSPPLTRRPTASPDVIGLFPEPGASR